VPAGQCRFRSGTSSLASAGSSQRHRCN
jgi:hypothetical protein